MKKKISIKGWPIMAECCPSCPFRLGPDGRERDPLLAARVKKTVLTIGSQICHHPRLHGGAETHLCRGARNFQLMIFYRLGWIESETDGAWEKAKGAACKNFRPSMGN